MEQSIKWIKINERIYALNDGNRQLAQFDVKLNKIYVKDANDKFSKELLIRKTGFWNPVYEMIDSDGKILLKVVREKWYSNGRKIQLGNHQFDLNYINKPLASLSLSEYGKPIIEYNTNSKKETGKVMVHEYESNQPVLLHAICWFFYLPHSRETCGGDISFITGSI